MDPNLAEIARLQLIVDRQAPVIAAARSWRARGDGAYRNSTNCQCDVCVLSRAVDELDELEGLVVGGA